MTAPVIGLVGAKRSGKDSFASFLVARHGYQRLAFADRLKSVALAIDPSIRVPAMPGAVPLSSVVRADGWEDAKELPDVRGFLQRLGTAVRDQLDARAWVEPVAEAAFRSAFARDTPVVVTDVRFPNEVDALRDLGGLIVKIERPGQLQDDAHVSEALAWDDSLVPWLVVDNGGTLEDLAAAAAMAAQDARAHVAERHRRQR